MRDPRQRLTRPGRAPKLQVLEAVLGDSVAAALALVQPLRDLGSPIVQRVQVTRGDHKQCDPLDAVVSEPIADQRAAIERRRLDVVESDEDRALTRTLGRSNHEHISAMFAFLQANHVTKRRLTGVEPVNPNVVIKILTSSRRRLAELSHASLTNSPRALEYCDALGCRARGPHSRPAPRARGKVPGAFVAPLSARSHF
jgi:hypothetical protein